LSDSTTRECFEKLLTRSIERAQAELDRIDTDLEGEALIAKLVRIEQADRQVRFAQRVAELDASIRNARLKRLKAGVDLVLAVLLPCMITLLLILGVAASSVTARTSLLATAVALAAVARGTGVSGRGAR
jgi:hypothetical protein